MLDPFRIPERHPALLHESSLSYFAFCSPPPIQNSRATLLGSWSSRKPINRECRKWLSGVHSTNSNCPTSSGFSHRHALILSAVSPSPHRPLLASGRLVKGHLSVARLWKR